MDFDSAIKHMERDIATALERSVHLRCAFEAAKEFTGNFLDECAKAGITRVAIGRKHKSVPSSESYPFGARGSVFAFQPKGVREASTWPPIWGVCERMGVSAGCGNTDQHQVDGSELIDGVYHLKKGVFHKVD